MTARRFRRTVFIVDGNVSEPLGPRPVQTTKILAHLFHLALIPAANGARNRSGCVAGILRRGL